MPVISIMPDTPAGDTPACDNSHLCGICQFPLVGDTLEQVESLLCGHPFHHFCVHKYAETMHCTLAQLACPMCRRVGTDIDSSLDATINVDSQDNQDPWADDGYQDPSAAGSQDPWEAGRWCKGTGKVGTISACVCIPKIDLLIDLRNPPTHPDRSIATPWILPVGRPRGAGNNQPGRRARTKPKLSIFVP